MCVASRSVSGMRVARIAHPVTRVCCVIGMSGRRGGHPMTGVRVCVLMHPLVCARVRVRIARRGGMVAVNVRGGFCRWKGDGLAAVVDTPI